MDPLLLPPLAPLAPLAPPSAPPSSVPLSVNLQDVHIAQVATAPPPKQHGPNHLNHPPYAEMIISAIKTLNEKKGSSRKAIAKFIDSTYTNLPQSHAALLSHHLRRLKKNGIVLMIKHSYKLPKSSPPPTSTATGFATGTTESGPSGLLPKRGRGRPPKTKPIIGPDGSVSVLPKKGRGRPPMSLTKPKAIDRAGPRPRGRPKRNVSGSDFGSISVIVPHMVVVPPKATATVVSATGRPVGRPRKMNMDSTVVGGVVNPSRVSPGRPVGRPRKVGGVVKPKSVSTGRPVGRPPKVGGVVKPKRVSTGRPVGRPPKVGGRGRPPKVAGVEKPVSVPTGKPVGRPRKAHLKERAVKLLEESLALGLNQDVPTMLRRDTELYHIITGREYHAGEGAKDVALTPWLLPISVPAKPTGQGWVWTRINEWSIKEGGGCLSIINRELKTKCPGFEKAKITSLDFNLTSESERLSVSKMSAGELACTYASMILHDDGISISAEKIATLVKSANVDVEPFWPSLFAKLLQKINVEDLITNVGSGSGGGGGGGGAVAPAAPSGGGAAAATAAPAAEEKKEEPKEESDDDMGFSLFD
ncbi:Ribosomal protein L10/L12 [Macleaya cordata]|uniref:Ribosomal protein L10/L12 n=1 Tax=Macleaya cordata TaxID=56857 RepID=A0A200PU80_MACCD|nr:Ribosomal protein L10/L12 [Macleaya cordata]